MIKILGILIILFAFVNCTSVSKDSLENNNTVSKSSQNNDNTVYKDSSETIIYENGCVTFKNNNYVFIAILTNDIDKIDEYWNSVPYRQEFPNIQATRIFKKDDPLSLFLVYSSKNLDIDLTYEHWFLFPDGSESKYKPITKLERGAYDNNLVHAKIYRDKVLEIEKGNIPRNTLFRATSVKVIFNENSLFGEYKFNFNIYNKKELITNLSLDFLRVE